MENIKNLFVYGTFMKGFFNHKPLEGKVISRTFGKVHGILYHQTQKGYPAMIPGNGWVIGEFLELENFDNLISTCDRLENYFGSNHHDSEYERRVSEVKLENGKKSLAWVYWYNRNDLDSFKNPAVRVPSGNWREFMMAQKCLSPESFSIGAGMSAPDSALFEQD